MKKSLLFPFSLFLLAPTAFADNAKCGQISDCFSQPATAAVTATTTQPHATLGDLQKCGQISDCFSPPTTAAATAAQPHTALGDLKKCGQISDCFSKQFIPTIADTTPQTAAMQPVATQTAALPQADEFNNALRLERQRAMFLQWENWLKTAEKNGVFSERTIQTAEPLLQQLDGYPLQPYAHAAYLIARYRHASQNGLTENAPQDIAKLEQAIAAFAEQYPDLPPTAALNAARFKLLLAQNNLPTALALAEKAKLHSPEIQAALLAAQFRAAGGQTLQTSGQDVAPRSNHADQGKAQSTNAAVHSAVNANRDNANGDTPPSAALWHQFEAFWLKQAEIPADLNDMQQQWERAGLKTTAKILEKAIVLTAQKNAKGLGVLADQTDESDLKQALFAVQKILLSPEQLPSFAAAPPAADSAFFPLFQTALRYTVEPYLKTQAEQREKPDFAPYQAWAAQWQLNDADLRAWKIAFLSRFFDNTEAAFQAWRDREILTLKEDKLTERRLRTAIRQKENLNPWLAVLSPTAAEKQEWQYWAAKALPSPQKTRQKLTVLAAQRGFYPMLAAHQLKRPYQPSIVPSPQLNPDEQQQFAPLLAQIREWRQFGRTGAAKTLWRAALSHHEPPVQQRLSRYAQSQHWFDLAVAGSIQAKAWDDIPLRLPNAYAAYFDIALHKLPVRKPFAMAIARQESAFDPNAQSHANARGLMQLLPSTAKRTATQSGLPYNGENDLFNPLTNILLGTAHLAELNEKYPDNRMLIAAAYNAGAGRVEGWLARADGRLALDEFIATIPFYETRGYVQNVLAYAYYYQLLQGVKTPQMFTRSESDRLY